jgi:hypothetical protein
LKALSFIISALLSLLVAVPICCCSFKQEQVKAGKSCCHEQLPSDGKDKPSPCGCESDDARDKPETTRLLDLSIAGALPTDPEVTPVPLLFRNGSDVDPAEPWRMVHSQGDIFARYSRWMI